MPDHLKSDEAIKFHQGTSGIGGRHAPGDGIGFLRHEMGKSISHALSLILSSCGLQNLAPESPVVSRMKGSGLPLCFLSAVFYLFWTPSARVKTLHLGSCVITASLQAIRSGFSEIRDRGLCEGGTPPFTL